MHVIVCDLHWGVKRVSGTTEETQAALRNEQRIWFNAFVESLMAQSNGETVTLTCNGDLFDAFFVEPHILWEYITLLDGLMLRFPKLRLNLVMGNHDASAKGELLSAFHFTARYMIRIYGERVNAYSHYDGFSKIHGVPNNVWVIPHQLNSARFEVCLGHAEMHDNPGILLLHCNVRNKFAENSDHSLNINSETIRTLLDKGWTLVFGHEHIGYSQYEGKLTVIGNQIPNSIADCIGSGDKHAALITADGKVELIKTWSPEGDYIELDWHEIQDYSGSYRFIRIVGEASAEESEQVVRSVADLRKSNPAFIISNAVKIDGVALAEAEEVVIQVNEGLQGFNVLQFVMDQLSPEHQETTKKLLSPEHQETTKELLK